MHTGGGCGTGTVDKGPTFRRRCCKACVLYGSFHIPSRMCTCVGSGHSKQGLHIWVCGLRGRLALGFLGYLGTLLTKSSSCLPSVWDSGISETTDQTPKSFRAGEMALWVTVLATRPDDMSPQDLSGRSRDLILTSAHMSWHTLSPHQINTKISAILPEKSSMLKPTILGNI